MERDRERRRSIVGALAAIAAVVLLLVACNDDADSAAITPEPDVLDGSTYESTDVTGHDLVDGSLIALEFKSEAMAARAGCNTQTADYEVTDGTLRWTGPPASTSKACSSELEQQDRWLSDLLTSGMTASLDDSTLTLDNGDVTIVLESTK
jgi:heat shock protein HslJ